MRQSAAKVGYNTAYNDDYAAPPNKTGNAFAATAIALEGLAEATQSDHIAVANLTSANSTLTQQVKTINELKGMIKDVAQEVRAMKTMMKMLNISKTSANAVGTSNINAQQLHMFKRIQTKWCWSCRANGGHNSNRCKYQAPKHCTDATVDNIMGSNPFGMNHGCCKQT